MKSKPFGALFGLLALVAILSVAPAFGQTANEIDMASGAGASASAACVVSNNCFAPNPLTVAPGTTVTWKNTDTVSHYVTSGKASDETTGTVFDSGNLIKPGSTYQFTFANAGTFDYFCSVHPWMTGQVIVASAAAASTQSSGSMQAGSMNMTTSQSSNMSQTGSMNMTQPSNTPVQTGSMNMTVGQSSDNATHTGVENTTTTSQPTETVANTGSASVTGSNNSPTETNNAQPTTPTNTQYVSAPVVNTTPAPSDAQTSAWIAGIVIVAIMSGVGIWSTARRK
ncbi:MAG TPA: plastocyanin/azurin family copper-binding protein [Candidatus Nitrosotalea sp.]|nr:plastocyanin/azurin family copper-binding protein [Candidatus Nitrosotalea sp.]